MIVPPEDYRHRLVPKSILRYDIEKINIVSSSKTVFSSLVSGLSSVEGFPTAKTAFCAMAN